MDGNKTVTEAGSQSDTLISPTGSCTACGHHGETAG